MGKIEIEWKPGERSRGRIDWVQVLADLEHAEYTYAVVSVASGIPEGTLRGWKGGAQPRHADGEQLLTLWSSVTGKPRKSAPKAGVYDWRA